MSDTSPNAFYVEAEEKRKQAAEFASRANELEAQGRALDKEQADDDTVSSDEPVQEEQTTADDSGDRKRILGKK